MGKDQRCLKQSREAGSKPQGRYSLKMSFQEAVAKFFLFFSMAINTRQLKRIAYLVHFETKQSDSFILASFVKYSRVDVFGKSNRIGWRATERDQE